MASTADLPFPPLPDGPGGHLLPGPPLFPAVINATHRETDEHGNLSAYRWSDPLPFDVRPGERRQIDIHLSHEVLSGPAITSVTASLDARRDDPPLVPS